VGSPGFHKSALVNATGLDAVGSVGVKYPHIMSSARLLDVYFEG